MEKPEQRPLPEGMKIRPARVNDTEAIVELMMAEAHRGGGRLGDLGKSFNTLLHRHFITSRYGLSVVVERDGEVVANATGLVQSKAFFRDFVLRKGVLAGFVLIPSLFRWKNLSTIWGAMTYIPEASHEDPAAELVTMNTHSSCHRMGLATRMFFALMDEYRSLGVDAVKLGHIPVDNARAIAFWESLGSRFLRTEELYRRALARVYVYDIPG